MLSVKLNDNEEEIIVNYAKTQNISIDELVRTAVLEHIEDESDLKAYDEAMERHLADPITYTHAEVKRMFEDD
jgi:Arc/MetJ family transcription regulator